MKFKSETLLESLEEAKPLLQKHWEEIAHYKDIPLNPDYELYFQLEKIGVLKVFICRNDQYKILGYAVYVVRPNMHYKHSLMAMQDIIYLDPNGRGTGLFFLKWCDEQLKDMGCQVVFQHIKAAHNFGPALERIGYGLQDLIYSKRLDK